MAKMSAGWWREYRRRPGVRDKLLANERRYRAKHPERVAAAQRRYVEGNKEKVRAGQERYRAAGRAEAREAKDVPCGDCGGSFPIVCMDFDHREGEEKHPRLTHRENGYKRMPISMVALATQSIKAFREEVKKCDVVCANCHRIRTDDRRRREP